jgi:hypothetical protein
LAVTTFSDLIEETRNHVMTGQPDRLNVLDLTINNTTDTIQLRYDLLGVGPGTRLVIDLEEMHVLSVTGTQAGSSATVIRGHGGSTAVAHTGGVVAYINPQVSSYRIAKFLNQGLQDLSSYGLFQIKRVNFDWQPTKLGYNLNVTDLIDIWRISYDYPGVFKDWPEIDKQYWDIDQAADVTDFPQMKLVIRQGGHPGYPIHVAYKAGFTALTAIADDVLAVSGLHTEAHDLPPLLAALDLLMGREIKRSFLNRQPEPRRQQEVPPGSATESMQAIVAILQGRVTREIRRLKRRYPGAV